MVAIYMLQAGDDVTHLTLHQPYSPFGIPVSRQCSNVQVCKI